MQITKLGHSCLLVETSEAGVGRTALFDPGVFSKVTLSSIKSLDDIFITHMHTDHMDVAVVQKLVKKFPKVRVLAPPEAVEKLQQSGVVQATSEPPGGVQLFLSPHEDLSPFGTPPQEHGIHYLGKLSHPGDSHHFTETMPVLALPVTAPWGSMLRAAAVGQALKPRYIVPIHDWHWRTEAREQAYETLEQFFGTQGITFVKPVDGQPFTLDI
jgi:L-ascorbate metabolism protein UlaG (beta-lactamase superfamily)